MFPIGDFARRRTTPYVNWTLIAINVAVFIYMLVSLSTAQNIELGPFLISEQEQFFYDWGFVPACVGTYFGFDLDVAPRALNVCPTGDREPLQIFTSMFVHAGWAHIGGNMLFLWIFGDNVEDRLGHLRYLLFYLLCGVAAAAAQTALSLDTTVPSVGASGAIAGVMGAYLILYPTAMVQVVIFPLFFWPFVVPAVVLIGIWFAMQLVAGIGELGQATAGSGVAWWAHVGGFIAGAILVWFLKRPQSGRMRGARESPGAP